MTKQSAEFYTTQPGEESLWKGSRAYVVRNGEMRINYKGETIRYSDDLERAGIVDDELLSMMNVLYGTAERPDIFEVIDSPWFEVVSDDDQDGVVFHDLAEAVEYAKQLDLGNIPA